MRRSAPAKPHKRDGTWYLIRRVPKEYAALDRRGLVRISTGIAVSDDPRAVRAKDVIQQLAAELEAYWRGLLDGQSGEARLRFEAAQKRARALGLSYRTNTELAQGSTDDLIERIQLLLDRNSIEDEREVAAVMGGEERPSFLLSEVFDEFEAIVAETLIRKSERQIHKWRLPKKRAIANLIDVLGDVGIADITRQDAVKFRVWWQGRIRADGLDIATANKDIGHIAKMLTTIDMTHGLELKPVFRNLKLAGAKRRSRAAFTAEHVQDKLLAFGALGELNDEARHLVYLLADTGLRASEAVNLSAETIHLDAEIPYVSVRAIDRETKTDHSERDIPLVGCALAVMKLYPAGFIRYRDNADSLSAIVNKVMDEKGLLPTPKHTLYSLRHTFDDRLTDVEAPDKVNAALMGHKWVRPKYGKGPTLAQKHRWLQMIAFKPPKHL